MSFLFRKYLQSDETRDDSQAGPDDVDSEEEPPVAPLEFRLWPPSPKAQIILIAVAIGLFNLILIAIWAIALYYRS
jgi:hypothetical protein